MSVVLGDLPQISIPINNLVSLLLDFASSFYDLLLKRIAKHGLTWIPLHLRLHIFSAIFIVYTTLFAFSASRRQMRKISRNHKIHQGKNIRAKPVEIEIKVNKKIFL